MLFVRKIEREKGEGGGGGGGRRERNERKGGRQTEKY